MTNNTRDINDLSPKETREMFDRINHVLEDEFGIGEKSRTNFWSCVRVGNQILPALCESD